MNPEMEWVPVSDFLCVHRVQFWTMTLIYLEPILRKKYHLFVDITYKIARTPFVNKKKLKTEPLVNFR